MELVTGGAGFVGSHLCDALIKRGDEVVAIDNLITGRPDNIAHLLGNDRFSFIKQDVTEFLYVRGDVHAVLHLASPASPADFKQLPIQILKVGSLGTHNALGLAMAKGAKFLLASTSEVYGDPEVHPQTEDYWGRVNPIGPRGVYDEAKRFAEAMTMAYHQSHGVDSRIARIFNTFGPRMRLDDGRVLPNLIGQALGEDPLTVYGDGSQTRSFCYIDDLIAAFLLLVDLDRGGDVRDPVNLGNPNEVSILEIAREILELTDSESEIKFMDLPQDDPKVRCPDITRARNLIGWNPTINRRDGLLRTIEYFRGAMALA